MDSFLFNYVQNLMLKLYSSEIIVVCIGMNNIKQISKFRAALHDTRCYIIIITPTWVHR